MLDYPLPSQALQLLQSKPHPLALYAEDSSELDRLCAVAKHIAIEFVRCTNIQDWMRLVADQEQSAFPILSVSTVSDKSWAEISRFSQYALAHDRSGMVVTSMDGLDLLFGLLETTPLQLLADPDEIGLAVGILHGNRTSVGRYLRESDRPDPRALHQLSEQMAEMARSIAQLAGSTQAPPATLRDASKRGDTKPLEARVLREEIRRRRARDQYFDAALFADPAWDMLLDLMAARIEGRQVSVSSLCIAAAVPPTTALRWIKTMTDMGLLIREADPEDARRVFIALSDEAALQMRRYFSEVS